MAGVATAVEARAPQVIVDLAGLKFIDSSGVAALARGRNHPRHAGGDLLLAAPQQLVLRLLSLTDLTELLPVFASVDQAANDGGRPAALPWLARDQAGGEAPPGNGEVHRARDHASPAESR